MYKRNESLNSNTTYRWESVVVALPREQQRVCRKMFQLQSGESIIASMRLEE
jgi:hypothetical protein